MAFIVPSVQLIAVNLVAIVIYGERVGIVEGVALGLAVVAVAVALITLVPQLV